MFRSVTSTMMAKEDKSKECSILLEPSVFRVAMMILDRSTRMKMANVNVRMVKS